ncbi:MAG: sensor histidine kinase [Vicinamibacterales bacterium]
MRLLPADSEHGWTPYLWLVYLAPYALFPYVTGAAPGGWLLQAAGLATFLPLYFRGYWVDGSARLPIILGIAALGVSLSWLNLGALSFFIYAAAFVGGARTGTAAGWWIGGLTLAGVSAAALSGWPATGLGYAATIAPVAIVTPLIGFVNVHYASVRRRDAALNLAQEEIARLAAVAERQRIAGDLHDLLGHTLSVITLKADLAAKLVERDQARAAVEIAEVARISREALGEVRRAVHGIKSARLADELARARSVLGSAGIELTISQPGGGDATPLPPGTPPATEHALALVCREAVTNVIRHARATRCRIALTVTPDHLHLEVDDDGVGGELAEGHGLAGMRARLLEVGGSLERDGRRGMRLLAVVPRAGEAAG